MNTEYGVMDPNGGTGLHEGGNGQPPKSAAQAAAFGEFLKTHREQSGLSLDEVSAQTKIQPRHFLALERGDVDALPRGMYARAMLRAYSESVGLDTRQVVDEFQRVFKPPSEDPISAIASARPEPPAKKTRRPPAMLIAALTGLAIGAAIFFATRGMFGQDAAQIVPVATRTVAQPAEAAPATPVPAVQPKAAQSTTAAVGTSGQPTPAVATTPSATDAALVVTSDPPGARVTVNGIGWGETPVTIRYLPFGAKQVRVIMPGYQSAERAIRLDPDRPRATLNIKLRPRPVANVPADQQE